MPTDQGNAAAVCRIDLHVHSRRYSPCAELLDPSQVAGPASRAGLQGIVFAEHDRMWQIKETAALNCRFKGITIFRGMEVSAGQGHFVVIGLDCAEGIMPGMDIDDLLAIAHRQNAAVILVHPYMTYTNTARPLAITDMPGDIDAVEVCSCVTRHQDTERAVAEARRRGWAQVGGSDAHCPGQIGQACTRFSARPRNEKELAGMIRSGLTEPICSR